MDVALLNTKIKFQVNTLVTDSIGNHTNTWSDYYTCHATVSGEGGTESLKAGNILADVDVSFTVRYSNKTKSINPTSYRVIFMNDIYDIILVDHLSFKKNALKLKCKKAVR